MSTPYCPALFQLILSRALSRSEDERSSMKRVTPVILGAAALLVALDIIGALTGRPLGFPYSRLGTVSLFVYLSVGLLAPLRGGLTVAVVAAVAVGFLD